VALLFPLGLGWQHYGDRKLEAEMGEPLGLWRTALKSGEMGERLASGFDDLPPQTILLADWEQITPLWYLQQVEGVRPDITLVYPIERLSEFAAQDRPLCLARHYPVDERWHLTNVDALVCLQRNPAQTLSARMTPQDTTLVTQAKRTFGWRGRGSRIRRSAPGGDVTVMLGWEALRALEHDYSISLRLLDEAWQEVWKQDQQHPVMGLYATSRWAAGEVVQDWHEITVARDLPPGVYLWGVVVYRATPPGDFENLRDTAGNIVIYGGSLQVLPR
ncbi:MAG: hypothetical protein HC915_11050, partial [Anaerolineae bacterium]|nr:hypothetical protein [Anaerolineae bacterium]